MCIDLHGKMNSSLVYFANCLQQLYTTLWRFIISQIWWNQTFSSPEAPAIMVFKVLVDIAIALTMCWKWRVTALSPKCLRASIRKYNKCLMASQIPVLPGVHFAYNLASSNRLYYICEKLNIVDIMLYKLTQDWNI